MTDETSLVTGDGWISDESNFVGSKSKVRKLEHKSQQRPLDQIVRTWQRSQQITPQALKVLAPAGNQNKLLFNRLEGDRSARQLDETIDQFITRLPPGNCPFVDDHWIWICNPHIQGKGKAAEDRGFSAELRDRAEQLMERYDTGRAKIESEMEGKAKGAITRKLTPLRTRLKDGLLRAAKEERCLYGKWMLFPTKEEVGRVWKLVAQGVADNRLGDTAKVAADSENGDSGGILICVYTKDFSDLDDVSRVLSELVDLGLCSAEGRGIYYKCDAYTYLDIGSKNDYGLKASLYWSRDVLSGNPS